MKRTVKDLLNDRTYAPIMEKLFAPELKNIKPLIFGIGTQVLINKRIQTMEN
jgi:hypothetical protein